jgi:hypothetical protein
MKTRTLLIALSLTAGLLSSFAAEKKVEAGPNGGRLLEKTSPKAEFLVEKDHNVKVSFFDASLKPVAATGQHVTVIADAKGGKTKLEFEKKGDVLVSKTKLPDGDGYPVVVQFKQDAEAKPQNFRFDLELHLCGGCKRAEYACTCGH